MLRLDRKNEDARNAIPGLLLQFDRDQDAYDFIVWFQRGWKKHGYTYDWLYDDLDKPMLDLHGADPSAEEALELWSRLDDQEIAKLSLERASCAMLIMVRLSLGLAVAVDNQKEFKTKTVVETMKYAHRSFPVGLLELHPEWVEQINDPAFTKTKNGLMGRAAGIALLLADAIKKHNRLYYDMLGKPFMRGGYRDPHEDFDFVTMDDGSQVSLPEARLAFDYTFAAWDRTPGALEHIMSSARENLGL
ncbi:hypothetical protein QBC47DRAFT_389272 [Echria macrotheca]|uniref:Uncharacterized protein n=1 Tax=Echria macrotheca TaxID=438768 RepID=A0AAJ0F954_9PEZI|nr:hypothetical protein QBC47DRAFT_389272 [Echria macrotheca]